MIETNSPYGYGPVWSVARLYDDGDIEPVTGNDMIAPIAATAARDRGDKAPGVYVAFLGNKYPSDRQYILLFRHANQDNDPFSVFYGSLKEIRDAILKWEDSGLNDNYHKYWLIVAPIDYPVVENDTILDFLKSDIASLENGGSLPGTADYDLLCAFRAIRNTYGSATVSIPAKARSSTETTPLFWDCNCGTHYMHPATQTECQTCGAKSAECPDSRVSEVISNVAKMMSGL